MDKRFKVEVLAKTPNPQSLVYAAMHQDYSSDFVFGDWSEDKFPNEIKCGNVAVRRLLGNKRGHFGPLEHPQITFNCGYFPHSIISQARTHRVGISFDVQSFRYTGKHFLDAYDLGLDIEDLFYLRPEGYYTDREGKKYEYTEKMRFNDLKWCETALEQYYHDFKRRGMSEEHCRGKLPYDYRQHFVVSFNLRSLMHFLDLRSKKDAQLEIQWLCELMLPHFKEWTPEFYEWYYEKRLKKALPSP